VVLGGGHGQGLAAAAVHLGNQVLKFHVFCTSVQASSGFLCGNAAKTAAAPRRSTGKALAGIPCEKNNTLCPAGQGRDCGREPAACRGGALRELPQNIGEYSS